MNKLFSFILVLLMVIPLYLFSQDGEGIGPFGRNIGSVYNRPVFSRGASFYADWSLSFRNRYNLMYSSDDSSMVWHVDTLTFNIDYIKQGQGFWANCPLPISDPSGSFRYFEDFIGIPSQALVVTTNGIPIKSSKYRKLPDGSDIGKGQLAQNRSEEHTSELQSRLHL